MNLNLRNLQTMLSSMAAAAQAQCVTLLDLSFGSPVRAVLYAVATQFSWQQNNINLLLATTRLATCSGSDVDSFVGDYGLFREAGTFATGAVTLARFVPASSATVLVGDTVRTGDGSYTWTITADSTNPIWSASTGTSGGYIIPLGTASATVPIVAQIVGVGPNCIAGAISLMGSSIANVDTVSNALAIENGANPQSDASLKIGFVSYIAALTRGTLQACINAVNSVQSDVSCEIEENVDEAGNARPGHFVVYVDNVSGSPSPALLSTIYAAVDAVRPVCSTFSVQPAQAPSLSIALTVSVNTGTVASLAAAIQQAISVYVDAVGVGGIVSLFGIMQSTAAVSTSITNVSGVSINGYNTDYVSGATASPKAGTVTVS
jgi:hypothetical protein